MLKSKLIKIININNREVLQMNNKELVDGILSLTKEVSRVNGQLSILVPKIENLDNTQDELKEKIAAINKTLSLQKANKEFSIKLIGLIVSISALMSSLAFGITKLILE